MKIEDSEVWRIQQHGFRLADDLFTLRRAVDKMITAEDRWLEAKFRKSWLELAWWECFERWRRRVLEMLP